MVKRYSYAQINEENICIAVGNFTQEVIADYMIPLPSYDTSLLGKKYENGAWSDADATDTNVPVTNEDLMEEIKKSQQDIIDEYTLQLIEEGVL